MYLTDHLAISVTSLKLSQKKKKKKKRLVTPSFGIHDTKLSRYMGIRGVMCVAYSAFHPNRVARFLGHFQQINL